MSEFIASLPMYDWPETLAATDAEWAAIRGRLVAAGVPAPEHLTRDVEMHAAWRMPNLLFSQTCWGPLELGLAQHVTVLAQPDYSAFEGGAGELYSSAVVMRRGEGRPAPSPADGRALLPLDQMRGKRFAFNNPDSMSGLLAVTRDLAADGAQLDSFFAERIESGSHRASIAAVAEGRADVATVDCRSWALAQRFEPAAQEVEVVGWTARRKGLPYIASPAMVERFPGLATALR
jgi:ABC-type phosphate/phosphonate transport system substrate-binding protein